MRNRHITRFGSPLAPSGALYYVTDVEGLIQMDVDIKLVQLYASGELITPEVKSQVKSDVKRMKAEYHDKVNQIGVPDKLRDLFLITRKAEAEQYSRQIVLSEYDLFLLIHNCNQIGFTHRSKFKQYVPQHLTLSDNNRSKMKTANAKKSIKNIGSILLERRYIHVHRFEYGSDWHYFYFSHQDIEPTSTNHWKYGCHLHYISHLWPRLKKRWIWNKFNQRSTEISDSLHIRFEPFKFPHPDEAIENYLVNGSKLSPWAVIFSPSLASGCGSVPLPVAQVATRGVFITQVYLPSKLNQ
ncbi:MAG: hypothetical protein IMY88_00170 [Chloroflexi bacterium]|nr:hypothetical protein [Chloroflexota bacterium]